MANQEADKLSDEGMRLINERRWQEALEVLDRSLALDPTKANAIERRKEAAAGLAGAAAPAPEAGAETGQPPGSGPPMAPPPVVPGADDPVTRSWTARREGRPAEAEALLREALAASPARIDALRALAGLLESRGETEASIRMLEQAAALDKESADLRLELGYALMRQGRAAQAEPPLREALALMPDRGECRFALARVLRWQDRLPEAEAAYRSALEAEPRRMEYHLNLAETLMRRGETAAVFAALEEAGTVCPPPADEDVAGLLERYRWALCALRYPEAARLGEAVLDRTRRFEHIEALRWPIFTEEFDYTTRTEDYLARAAAALDAFLAAQPQSPWGWYHHSLLSRMGRDRGDAPPSDLERLRGFAPARYGWMRLEGGRARLREGDLAGAEAELALVVAASEPGDWNAQLLIAEARARGRNLDAALEAVGRAETMVPASHRGIVLARKGELLLRAGRAAEALAVLDAALAHTSYAADPRDAEARRNREEAALLARRSP